MRRMWLALSGCLWLAATAHAQYAPTWLTPANEEQVVQGFAAKLAALPSASRPEHTLEEARRTVRELRARIDHLGLNNVLALAPTVPGAEVPALSHPLLTAMARYTLCKIPIGAVSQYGTPDDKDGRRRLAATVDILWIDAAFAFLRYHYYQQKGTDEEMKRQLTLPALNGIVARVESSAATAREVVQHCVPALEKLKGN